MKIFFSCKRCVTIVGEKHELKHLRDALTEVIEQDEPVAAFFKHGKNTRCPLGVTIHEGLMTCPNPDKKYICP